MQSSVSPESLHVPVLCSEVLQYLAPHAGGHYLDGTLGLGGHTEAILRSCDTAEVLGIDRDTEALGLARTRLAPFGPRLHTCHGNYADFPQFLAETGWDALDGALLDIGVSSMQLDRQERGFSFHADSRLDMRMDRSAGEDACTLVSTAGEERLREILAVYGEEPLADAIARRIVQTREQRPLETTRDLAELVSSVYAGTWRTRSRHHPATRTFQALRIAVNDELGSLSGFLDGILAALVPGGRLVIITFHSLEDRIVKQTMQRWAKGCLCPPYIRTCVCHHTPEVTLLTRKPVQADAGERARNPRSTSAKLRAVEKRA